MASSSPVRSDLRLRVRVDRPLRPGGGFVLYWMTAARRLVWNHALDRAIELATDLGRPLVVLEALRCGSRWASDRTHAFVLQGMEENQRRAGSAPILYYPYVERRPGEGSGLVEALSREACAVIGDDFPCFFLPHMIDAAARRIECRFETVDSNGLLPVAACVRTQPTAYAFRRFLQRELKAHLLQTPAAEPLARLALPRLERLPRAIAERWPRADGRLLAADAGALGELPIDHGVGPAASSAGGSRAAESALSRFLDERLDRYGEERNHPDRDAGSGLSPWLHFGHLSSHQVLAEIGERENWAAETLPSGGTGAREGWWGMSAAAEGFLDQLVTWRELGFNFCATRPDDCDRYESLPEWARASLDRHAGDARDALYPIEALAAGETADELWNAAQRQLVAEGRIHNYLRMLWGKRVLEWTRSPREALAALIELNNRFALDGRDPNSYSGIFWCLGRYDRPWAPARPIFGVVRYMSSANTRRKLRLKEYLARWSPPPASGA